MKKIIAHLLSELRAAKHEGFEYDTQGFDSDARRRLGIKADYAWISQTESVGVELHIDPRIDAVADRARAVAALRKLADELERFERDIE